MRTQTTAMLAWHENSGTALRHAAGAACMARAAHLAVVGVAARCKASFHGINFQRNSFELMALYVQDLSSI